MWSFTHLPDLPQKWWWMINCLVVWNMIFFSPSYWECHHPNWRTPSFFRGVAKNRQPVNVFENGWSLSGLFGSPLSAILDHFGPIQRHMDVRKNLSKPFRFGRWFGDRLRIWDFAGIIASLTEGIYETKQKETYLGQWQYHCSPLDIGIHGKIEWGSTAIDSDWAQ